MQEIILEAQPRGGRGKNEARRLRQNGRIPAVVYGSSGSDGGGQTTAIAVDPKALMKILHSESGANTLIGLKVGDETMRVLVKDYQLEPINHALLHADFYRVAMDRTITVTVPIVLKGEPRGVKQQGGILDFVHREIDVECLPGDIPENVEVDVSELMVGQSVRLRDLPQSPRWKAVSEGDLMLAHVITPRAEEAPAAAETPTAPAEPEVIKKGKAEKGEEEG
jgi:large subunit ribosomal protein L25